MVTEEDRRGFVLTGAKKCFEAGYTSVQDVIIATSTDVKLYMDMAEEGKSADKRLHATVCRVFGRRQDGAKRGEPLEGRKPQLREGGK